MPYQEIDTEGNPVLGEDEKPIIIDDIGSWDQVKGHIPEELKEEKMWENVKDVPGLLKSYAHAQKSLGGSIKVPSAEAGDDEWSEFYGKLGRPEGPDDYKIEWPELEGATWDEDLQTGFKALAHKIGLTPAQVTSLVEFEGGRMGEVADKGAKGRKEAEEALQTEWGGNFTRNVAYAQRAVSHLGGLELKKVMDESGLGNHPVIAKAMYRIGKMMVEDGIIPGEVQGAVTKEQALAEISKVMADAGHVYHKGDKDAVAEMSKLHQIAYNE